MRVYQAEFERRCNLYAHYDAQLCDRTRFFAAAALVNQVLARLCAGVRPINSAPSLSFLNEAGAVLEHANRAFASQLSRRGSKSTIDHALVCAEQGHLQCYVLAYQAQRPQRWQLIRSELNRLLNKRRAASLFCRWWGSAGILARALSEVRGQLCVQLDFADESHRISIGMKLIEKIRFDGSTPIR